MSRFRAWVVRHRVLTVVLVVTLAVGGYLGYHGVRTFLAWRGLERLPFDVAASRDELAGVSTTLGSGVTTIPVIPVDPLVDADLDAYLVIGSDERPRASSDARVYGDAVLLYLVPSDGDPALVSLPRDLLITNPCTGAPAKINSMLAGCGATVSGAELVAVAVEDFAGFRIDHFALVRFDAFVDVIDGLGGIDLCVNRALRDSPTRDLVPAGCSRVDGATALRFVKSRNTLELVEGEWRAVEGASDLTRARREQAVLLALLARAKTVRTPSGLADLVASLDDGALVLDETLSMSDAIGLAWELRSTPGGSIRRIVLPVEATVTADGRFAVTATATVLEVLARP